MMENLWGDDDEVDNAALFDDSDEEDNDALFDDDRPLFVESVDYQEIDVYSSTPAASNRADEQDLESEPLIELSLEANPDTYDEYDDVDLEPTPVEPPAYDRNRTTRRTDEVELFIDSIDDDDAEMDVSPGMTSRANGTDVTSDLDVDTVDTSIDIDRDVEPGNAVLDGPSAYSSPAAPTVEDTNGWGEEEAIAPDTQAEGEPLPDLETIGSGGSNTPFSDAPFIAAESGTDALDLYLDEAAVSKPEGPVPNTLEPFEVDETDAEALDAIAPVTSEGDRQPITLDSSADGAPDLSSSSLAEPLVGASATDADLAQRVAALQQEEQRLQRRIADLQASYNQQVQAQLTDAKGLLEQFMQEGLSELEKRKQVLEIAVEQLERRQERIRNEMRTTFAGASQDLAIRVQGFKDYLVGSLQDLVTAAEDLKLSVPEPPPPEPTQRRSPARSPEDTAPRPQFAEQGFEQQARAIRKLLDQYRNSPDYYGPPWQLRRTFEPIHAERVSNWFFTQGGRGAIRTMGSRLQNILIASAAISVLHRMYGDRVRTLVLSNSPERLGEWRRGLQDCLGLARLDFGSDQGVILFDAPEPLVQRADRLLKQKQMPLIIIDESEDVINLSLLQFPLWLAFAADPMNPPMVY
ncbi:DUF3086 domain-containing protein [Leptolyngbya sp. AN02str]|uniref:DUF3086 domain-containing protein n=1 Tax=Leptolyngbya sp. AN02str TaxID=3423363 RepID=UPI003D315783